MPSLRGGNRLGDSKVRDDCSPTRQKHVPGFDVTMHHSLRMRVRESASDIAQKIHTFPNWQNAFAREAVAQRASLDERHRIVGVSRSAAGREQWDDVRLLQRCGELDLAVEPFRVDASSQLRRQHLDDNASAQSHLAGEEHARHSTAVKLSLHRIRRVERCLKLG